ncbi:Similar to TRIM45: Tripartite motif-containing protein 45 (Bos taurus) [Cotesia congregata]|uniref:Similar to TRIM45: Tripartite motif-containing protein 45 (Bos taurus) n=1 Tax=Cotesia congregata TaxID=51543 RepID=A0A8J2E428_COTCN|nr:Similar to TRIM45: Tripartite motif-containing protein 45 (Bos taurus) [Cotesia congregata]
MASTTIAVPAASAPVVVTTMHKEEEGDPLVEWNSDAAGSDGTVGNTGDGEALEENPRANGINGNGSGGEDCALCEGKLTSPRLLSCLHVFCEACLDKLLEEDENKGSGINCPICGQRTAVGARGAASLPCDYVLTNILDMSAIENMTVLCTSCKAKESAVARCSDCANFLCPNCNTAHQFMRCFESHKVIAFEDLKRSNKTVPIHKPIFCDLHPAENIKFYCYTCQEPICNECLLVEHKTPEHQYERLSDAETSQIEELVNLMTESKNKIIECDSTSSHLENALSELQAQHDQAKDLIIETFQSYKAILEKCRDTALNDLEKLHSERELEVMDTFHKIKNSFRREERRKNRRCMPLYSKTSRARRLYRNSSSEANSSHSVDEFNKQHTQVEH